MKHSALKAFLQVMAGLLRQASCACRDFSRDPVAHPVLSSMSMTELADIPASELRALGRI
ncbi:MAG: hypothetical protein WBF87_11335 [Mesorhizobium sp.]